MDKKELKRIIKKEIELIYTDFFPNKKLRTRILISKLTKNIRYYKYKLIKYFRLFNYYQNTKGNLFKKFKYGRKYSKYSLLLHCQINCTTIGEGFYIEHPNIFIHKSVSIGKNCKLIGNNTISGGVILGDNVTMGINATVLGPTFIPNGTIIGANTVVSKTIEKENCVVVGVNKIIKER